MIGQTIAGYEIVAKLGEGGMGAVYLGEHRRIARKAAIKVLLADLSGNAEMLSRFFNEARATSMIRHPGIVEILDCDVLPDGNAYIAMEYLDGESLNDALAREGRLPVPLALALARHVADALSAAHERGIIHRDLKPDNLFLPKPGNGAGGNQTHPIKILDFGIAKLTTADQMGGQFKTHTGRVLGTPAYMSPEQCRGTREIDQRTDIYALACILFEMLTGRPPFEHPGFGQLIYAHLSTPPPALRSLDPSISPALEALVARMLAKSPAERPPSMKAVVAEIDQIAPAPAGTAPRISIKTPVATELFGVSRSRTPAPNVVPNWGAVRQPPAPRSSPSAPTEIETRPGTAAKTGAKTATKTATTLREAASEQMTDVDEAPPSFAAGRGRGRGLVVAVAAAAAVLGVGYWRLQASRGTSGGGTSPAASSVAVAQQPSPATPEPAAAPVPAAAPAADLAPPQPVAAPAPAARSAGPSRAAVAAANRPLPVREPAPAEAATVKLVIATDPPGADVCLAKDGVLLGKTRFAWTGARGTEPLKFRIGKGGYRSAEVTFTPSRDGEKQIKLRQLDADDIEDLETCHEP